ncbi:Cell division and transport-associated protein TolA [Humidesulfovibrio mexicanus]|uniref:Cell division and transport-associated protein TolA n=1 Tax=Humidesulfovibrio mexicanus TaxID=147047 RepID=A0A239D4F3_9BACT|nr:TonB family protein [Humidesulfovibrio mexicanus]SNS27109.1 Cell division and transport-associated protein TolA [Humidesulfovibrio mexicanus]
MRESRRSTGFMLSLALHAMLVTLAMMNLSATLKVDMDKPMYTVDLVSLNPSEDPAAGETGEAAGAPPALAEGQQEEQAAAAIAPPPAPAQAKPEPKPAPKVDDAKAISEKKVEEKPKPEKKEDKTPPQPAKPEEKKPTKEELLKQALQDVKQDVSAKAKTAKAPAAKPDPVAGELAALRKSTGGNIFTAGGTGPGGAGGGKGTGAGGTGTGLMSVYGDIVKQIIKKNWRYPAFGTETNVAVTLEIKIDPRQGKILGSKVVTSSGNQIFDNSAMNAVAQTETLPPPRVKTLDTLRITFNLQEMLK